MDIKLIALDLDGTLLNSEKRLSQANRDALACCCRQGIYIVPTTGRTVDGIDASIKSIPGLRYAITTNGAVIEDMTENRTLDRREMPWKTAVEVMETVAPYHVMYDSYVNGRGITEPRFFDHMEEFGLTPELMEMVRMTRDVYDNVIDRVKTEEKDVQKINLFFSDREVRAKVRGLLEMRDDILVTSSMVQNLEINAVGATKGEGILRLANILGLTREQTMAMGDGENDFSMIQTAGLGVAMKNGHPKLQSIADYITDTNDEDGVAAAIYRFVLGQHKE